MENSVKSKIKKEIVKVSQSIVWDSKELYNYRETENLRDSLAIIESLEKDLETLKLLRNLLD
tara:strand:- start:214 stop:399 length:186 start_codon:yes stop_codon:yes gene_type:complete